MSDMYMMFSLRLDMEAITRTMTPEQLQALMGGMAKVMAASKASPAVTSPAPGHARRATEGEQR